MRMRKGLALALALVLTLSLLGVPAAAVEENSGTWGDNVTWTLTENEDEVKYGENVKKGLTLTFTGRGKMMDCEDAPSATPWAGNWDITRVVINAGITSVPDFLCTNDWGGCLNNLSSVSLSATIETIGRRAFAGTKLKTFHIPGGVKSIASSALNGCNELAEITVEVSNQNYRAVDGVLYSKGENAELVKYPAAKIDMDYTVPDGIKTIPANAFAGNDFLQTIVLPDSLTGIGAYAFDGCSSLQTIN